MSGRFDKRVRQEAEKQQLLNLSQAVKDIQAWPFRKRFGFAWSIVFPPKVKQPPQFKHAHPSTRRD